MRALTDADAAAYIDAALNKIALANRHLELLNELRQGDEREQLDVQMHFDGVLQSVRRPATNSPSQ